jgi:dsRNA-specific ribonuclease
MAIPLKSNPLKKLAFVKFLLNTADPTPNFVERIFALPDAETKIVNAFTHKSVDPVNNYDVLKIKGEVIVNEFMAFYIIKRFPKIVSLKYRTRIKHTVFHTRQLAKTLLKYGFGDLVLLGEEIEENLVLIKDPTKSQIYLNPIEGSAMGIFGCIEELILELDLSRGTASDVIWRILRWLFDQEEIATDYELIFDPVTRLKELTTTTELDWKKGKMYDITKTKFEIAPSKKKIAAAAERNEPEPGPTFSEIVHVKVFGWPLKDRRYYPQDPSINRVELAEATESSESEAKMAAAFKALEVLKSYGIRERVQSSSYTAAPRFAAPFVQPPPDSTLKIFVKDLLDKASLDSEHSDKILTDRNIGLIKMAFTHSSVDSINNYELLEVKGDVIINRFVVGYITVRMADEIAAIKRQNLVEYLTKIKHILISKEQFASYSVKFGFEKFIRYSKQFTADEYSSLLEDVFEGFFGGLYDIIVGSGFSHGAATDTIGNILKYMFDQGEIVFGVDAVTKLKELYESKVIGLNWPNKEMLRVYKEGSQTRVIVYGWPKGDKTPVPSNRIVLGEAVDPSEKMAKRKAAEIALEVLDKTYQIRGVQKF